MRSAIRALVIALSAASSIPLLAQMPAGSPPPSYGTAFTTATPLEGFEMRRFREWQLTVNVEVPAAEVTPLLPVGWVLENPQSLVVVASIAFVLQERLQVMSPIGAVAAGSYGPVDEVLVLVPALSPMNVVEFVILDNLRSTQAAVDLANAIFGAKSARLPSQLNIQVTEDKLTGTLQVRGLVVADNFTINVAGAIPWTTPVATLRNSFAPRPFRYINHTNLPTTWNKSVRAGFGLDQMPIALPNLSFTAEVSLSQGPVVTRVISARVDRWQELMQKIQPN